MNEQLAGAGLRKLPTSSNFGEGKLGQVSVKWFCDEKEVDVIFEIAEPSAGPTQSQVDAFCQFMKEQESLFEAIQQQLLDHYNEEKADSTLDEETVAELFPAVSDPRHLGRMTDLGAIIISYFNGEWSSYIGILAECSWEEEHGLGIKVVDGVAVEFGYQDIVI